MKRLLFLTRVCVLTSILCLSLAYTLAGYWFILLVFPAMTLFWIFLKRWSLFRTSSALCSIFVLLAAIGVTLNLSIPLLLIACTTALASWDLTNFAHGLTDDQRTETSAPPSLRLEKVHLRSLVVAASAGLSLAFISLSVTLQIPFWGILLLVLIAMGGLTYGWQALAKNP